MISDHEANALDHSRILEFHKFFSEYHIWLEVGSDRFNIKIRVFETNDGRFYFVQSHYVRLPFEEGDAHQTFLSHATPHLALSKAVDSITTYYEDAVAGGHKPCLEWFVPNEGF